MGAIVVYSRRHCLSPGGSIHRFYLKSLPEIERSPLAFEYDVNDRHGKCAVCKKRCVEKVI